MKTKIIIAVVAIAALCSIAYFTIQKNGLLNSSIPKETKFTIVGEWKLDSAFNNKDSGNLSLLAIAFSDSNVVFKFNADSTLQTISPNEVTKQNYYVNNDSLFIKEDSTYTLTMLQAKSDSIITLINKDSTIYILSRKLAK